MKLIFHNHPGFPPSQHPPTKGFERRDSHSTYSTVSEKDASSLEELPLPKHKHHHAGRVRFDEHATIIDRSPRGEGAINDLWFTRQEFANFRRETMLQAQECLESEDNPTSALSKAYQDFCTIQTAADMLDVLNHQSTTQTLAVSTIGLDRLLVPLILQDKVERRKRILKQVQTMQALYKYATTCTKEDKVRVASRTLSQPSRLYAYHLARLAARSGN